MNRLENLIIHCTATPANMVITRSMIEKWHLQERGWSRLGYSGIIHQQGIIQSLTPWNQDEFISNTEMTWGVKGFNSNSRHIVYAGGADSKGNALDTLNLAQRRCLKAYIDFHIAYYPRIKVWGHNQLDPSKDCPSFDVTEFMRYNGYSKDNIGLLN